MSDGPILIAYDGSDYAKAAIEQAAAQLRGRLADGASDAAALTSGYHLAFNVGAGLVAVAILVAVILLERVTAAKEDEDVAR